MQDQNMLPSKCKLKMCYLANQNMLPSKCKLKICYLANQNMLSSKCKLKEKGTFTFQTLSPLLSFVSDALCFSFCLWLCLWVFDLLTSLFFFIGFGLLLAFDLAFAFGLPGGFWTDFFGVTALGAFGVPGSSFFLSFFSSSVSSIASAETSASSSAFSPLVPPAAAGRFMAPRRGKCEIYLCFDLFFPKVSMIECIGLVLFLNFNVFFEIFIYIKKTFKTNIYSPTMVSLWCQFDVNWHQTDTTKIPNWH